MALVAAVSRYARNLIFIPLTAAGVVMIEEMSFISDKSVDVAAGRDMETFCHALPSQISSFAAVRIIVRRYSWVIVTEETSASFGILGLKTNSKYFDSSYAPVPGQATLEAIRFSSLAESLNISPLELVVSAEAVPFVESVPDTGTKETVSASAWKNRETPKTISIKIFVLTFLFKNFEKF